MNKVHTNPGWSRETIFRPSVVFCQIISHVCTRLVFLEHEIRRKAHKNIHKQSFAMMPLLKHQNLVIWNQLSSETVSVIRYNLMMIHNPGWPSHNKLIKGDRLPYHLSSIAYYSQLMSQIMGEKKNQTHVLRKNVADGLVLQVLRFRGMYGDLLTGVWSRQKNHAWSWIPCLGLPVRLTRDFTMPRVPFSEITNDFSFTKLCIASWCRSLDALDDLRHQGMEVISVVSRN